MSTKISKKKFTELLRTLIKREIDEASTTASAGIDGTGTGHYDTPRAFSGKGKDRRNSVASGSGYEKVNEGGPGSGRPKDGSSKEKSKTDDKEMERRAKDQAKKDMEDEFDFDFDESINESATDFWMDMFRPGPIPNQYISQLIKKKGMLPSKSHIKRIYRDNGNPKSTDLAKAFKGLQKDKYIKKQGSLWRWEPGFTWEAVTEDAKDVAKARKLSQKLQNVEGRYRKAMYDLSDRLQADPKNHKLQNDLVKSYTKNVTSFMRDMVKITKRVK